MADIPERTDRYAVPEESEKCPLLCGNGQNGVRLLA